MNIGLILLVAPGRLVIFILIILISKHGRAVFPSSEGFFNVFCSKSYSFYHISVSIVQLELLEGILTFEALIKCDVSIISFQTVI